MRINKYSITVEEVFMIRLDTTKILFLILLLLCYDNNDHHHHGCSFHNIKKNHCVTAFSSNNILKTTISRTNNNPSLQSNSKMNNHYYPFFGIKKDIIVSDTILSSSLSSKTIQRNDDFYIHTRTKARRNNRLSMTFFSMSSSYSHSLAQKLYNTIDMNYEHSNKNDNDNNDITTTTTTATKRNIGSFQSWCDQVGIIYPSQYIDFYVADDTNDDCSLQLRHDAIAGTIIGVVPSHLLFSSKSIEIEFNNKMNKNNNNSSYQLAFDYLRQRGFYNQISQFYIFIKLLIEYERKEDSIWYLYIQSLPQTFYTSINMNNNELDLLPPMAYAIATTWKLQYEAFHNAIQLISDDHYHFEIHNNNNNITSTTTTTISLSNIKHDIELLKWAYNVVFTRCWSYRDDTISKQNTNDETTTNNNMHNNTSTTSMIHNNNNTNRIERIDLVPFGDMFNHVCIDEQKNIEISYNNVGDCIVTLTKDTKAGTPLLFSYGKETNSYHFLTIFGFVDINQQELLCEIQLPTTTTDSGFTHNNDGETNHIEQKQQIYKDMYFYDPSKMVFRTNDGAIGMVVWDYILYTLLDQNDMSDVKEQFYQAHLQNDTITKVSIHSQYHLETCILLKRHVDRTIQEMKHLHHKITSSEVQEQQQQRPEDENINSTTNRSDIIDLIRTNNEFVTNAFLKVQIRLNGLIQDEMKIRTKRT